MKPTNHHNQQKSSPPLAKGGRNAPLLGAILQIRNPKSEIRNSSRAGTTLTEVLIALLIMSIGLVSLAVLFPISVLRSIKAAQFTTATDNRYNAEAAIDLFPNMIRNPDYQIDVVTGQLLANSHNNENFVVDPLGYADLVIPSKPAATQAMAPFFGNDPSLALGVWTLKRYPLAQPGVLQTESGADAVVTMPDSWVSQHEGMRMVLASPPAGDGSTQIDVKGLAASGFTFPTLTAAQIADSRTPPSVRAVIFSGDGLTSQARQLTGIAGDTIQWTSPLPAAFATNPSGLGGVRIEWQERRYSWLLTVRKDVGGTASVDVVVFFKRKFEVNTDELLYPAVFTAGNNQATVTFAANSSPFLHKGNYVLDANNCFWYRISNVIPINSTSATVILDVPANASNSTYANPRAMFPRNIVDVYPIGTK